MTGLAQIRGHRGETDSVEKMQKRVECDLEYINRWSLWLDLKILFLTPFALFSRNAY
jgi:putative colanic acid biosynthesis UDP-glucose lipid carrier transferase